jgi:hypothetical protein
VGGLAGAIAAVLGLITAVRPSPDPEDKVTINRVEIGPLLSASEYERSASTGQGVVSTVSGLVQQPSSADASEILERLSTEVPDCRTYRGFCNSLVASQTTNSQGNHAPLEDAVREAVKTFKDGRQNEAGEPLGQIVTANVELEGLRGKSVLLSWSIWEKSGGPRVVEEWRDTHFTHSLVPTTDHDSTSVDQWIPIPKPPGPYFARVVLTLDGSPLASHDSPPFG